MSANLALCMLLGVERSDEALFENSLPILLRQIQVAAFTSKVSHVAMAQETTLSSYQNKMIAREALCSAMRLYSTDKATSCSLLLQSVHALLVASLALCRMRNKSDLGASWACFILEHTPMLLRVDLQLEYPKTCNAVQVFATLSETFPKSSPEAQIALCGALPILMTWDTPAFVAGTQVQQTVDFMLSLPEEQRSHALLGLSQLASVVLDRIEPFLDSIGQLAFETLMESKSPQK